MTDRHAAYLVVLADDIREDDAEESILIALRQIKGVQSVRPVISDTAVMIAQSREWARVRERLWELMRELS